MIVAAYGFQGFPPEDEVVSKPAAGGAEACGSGKVQVPDGMIKTLIEIKKTAAPGTLKYRRDYGPDPLVRHSADHGFDPARGRLTVRIGKEEEFPCGGGYTPGKGKLLPVGSGVVLKGDQGYRFIPGLEPAEQFPSSVIGNVINKNILHPGVLLQGKACQKGGEPFRFITEGNNHRNPGTRFRGRAGLSGNAVPVPQPLPEKSYPQGYMQSQEDKGKPKTKNIVYYQNTSDAFTTVKISGPVGFGDCPAAATGSLQP
jgi:hypothetical protein